mmetsp:Transcript_12094/g.17735  ORF Transcript_12094/g.17735 Transcript_12094/m.17735 type:complete len:223 (+) Transcript_12094:154-822(+)|eukprot:CAMPEP_0194201830 /NCGR_PEP_ID=MMETSP0156-20130528/1997_1 /TAXON_ID=33649 /ORGANISM="Thalassionema nitzschioides, Strain L26-B" /LENGTH=222 /DNA_ID=CAMNT_0038927129 /DNA_START=144 /DNA_END=812 /DNA_ORIENTATION=+
MKFYSVLSLALIGSTAAFVPAGTPRRAFFALEMSEDVPTASSKSAALVPIKEETVEFTAGLLGGVAGFAIGGPVFGAITAAISNYASKSDNEVSDVISAVSKSAIQIFNYLTTLDSKYEILKKAESSLEGSLNSLKSMDNVDPSTIEKVEKALSSTRDKITEINDEYDLVGAGTTALGVVGELVEKAITKAGELNEEYKLTDKAKESLSTAVDKAKASAQKA